MDEETDQGSERAAKTKLVHLENLLHSPGWAVLSDILQANVQERMEFLLKQPLPSLDAALGQEFLKGEAAAWQFLLELPEMEMSGHQAVVDAFRSARERTEEEKHG